MAQRSKNCVQALSRAVPDTYTAGLAISYRVGVQYTGM